MIHRELHVDGSSNVAVVGASPGGSTAAAFLARAGLHTLLLDKARFPCDKACGDAVCTKSLRILHELGLIEAVECEICAVRADTRRNAATSRTVSKTRFRLGNLTAKSRYSKSVGESGRCA